MTETKPTTVKPSIPVPEGFTSLTADRVRDYHILRAGNTIFGKLLGRFARKQKNDNGETVYFYQVKLMGQCLVTRYSENSDGVVTTAEVMAKPGTVINFDEKSDLSVLRDLLENEGDVAHIVHITPKEKRKLDGGKTFWEYDKHHRVADE